MAGRAEVRVSDYRIKIPITTPCSVCGGALFIVPSQAQVEGSGLVVVQPIDIEVSACIQCEYCDDINTFLSFLVTSTHLTCIEF